jgi:hypothetical protein
MSHAAFVELSIGLKKEYKKVHCKHLSSQHAVKAVVVVVVEISFIVASTIQSWRH